MIGLLKRLEMDRFKLKMQIEDIIIKDIKRAERIKKYKEELKEMEEILREVRYEKALKEDSSRCTSTGSRIKYKTKSHKLRKNGFFITCMKKLR